ncbi:helix-turn-helix transcriptional regulator [Microbacteriaceae bacterium VKM Ac-2854]|nr:helix-turn-helix transcriptional regulator [Microbacteriaceae bacterium VKM Ac-2854]
MSIASYRSDRSADPIALERIVVLRDGLGDACGVHSARNGCVVVAIEQVTPSPSDGPARARTTMLQHAPDTIAPVPGLQVHLPIELLGPDAAQLEAVPGPLRPSALSSAVYAVVSAVISAPPEQGTASGAALELSLLQLCRGLLAAIADQRREPGEPATPRFIALRDTVARLGISGRVTIDAVAAELGTSTAEVRFALASGNTTFSGLVRECRLMALAERIRTDESDVPLTRLPSEVGIDSYPQAARSFKARFGMTMGEYRRFVRL